MPEKPHITVAHWSQNPILRGLQEIWYNSDMTLSELIRESQVPRSKMYDIMVNGRANPTVKSLHMIALALGARCTWEKRK